ncbi:MAG: type 4a pilus biogenesis protein PilO [Actinomycetota bacterium]|nr:type 4a pilus biogenesis protein PilO [Actinomycetota bacterium]
MDNRRAPLYAGLAVAGVAILMVLLLVLPKMGQVSQAQDQLDQAQRDQQTLESRKSALEDAQAAAPQARKTIAEVQKRIPATAEEPGLILLLQHAAINAGIDLVSLSPGTPIFDTTSGLSKIAVGVSATGTYFDVTNFMYQIETLPRAAIVTNLSLAPGGTGATGEPQLTLTAAIQTYTSDTSAGPGSEPGPTSGGTG